MCGIFGIVAKEKVSKRDLSIMAKESERRGKDGAGLWLSSRLGASVEYSPRQKITKLIKNFTYKNISCVIGHARLATNGENDCQPIITKDVGVVHNGIVLNDDDLWLSAGLDRKQEVDSEIIVAIAQNELLKGTSVKDIPNIILGQCEGSISAALFFPKLGKIVLFSNTGSLYLGFKNGDAFFASELSTIKLIGCADIKQIKGAFHVILDMETTHSSQVNQNEMSSRIRMPAFKNHSQERELLKFPDFKLKRCSKCLLTESMPFIHFDSAGVCNYCKKYKPKRSVKSVSELINLLQPYKRADGPDCIIPLSGGRDSCYALHLAINELGLNPITYTYDWGMITDLGRRNISRMCATLGVENITFAADIAKKRENIKINLLAWLKSPDIGMLNILTAGDKHFFKYIEIAKRNTGIDLNLWGINPLETTHFKTGFLGVKPDFEQSGVYTVGVNKQIRYQLLRARSMFMNLGYFNSSLWDTLSGEYYRSCVGKKDYFHVFDYFPWAESEVERTLDYYDWERAFDTKTSWRIGDGSAAFYNYVYYIFAGFTEHDTFRSNQIREGLISRDEGLRFVSDENRPRYENIKWYFDVLGLDFTSTITAVNKILGKGISDSEKK